MHKPKTLNRYKDYLTNKINPNDEANIIDELVIILDIDILFNSTLTSLEEQFQLLIRTLNIAYKNPKYCS